MGMARRRGKAPGGGFPESKMRKSYKVTTQPTLEPITVLDGKLEARVDSDEELVRLQDRIRAARQYVEQHTSRALLTQTVKLVRSCWPTEKEDRRRRKIFLERTPLQSVTHVKYYPADGGVQATLDPSLYHVQPDFEPGQIELVSGQVWPDLADRSDAIEIVFVAGFTAVSEIPQRLREAIYHLVNTGYDFRQDFVTGTIISDLPDTHSIHGMMRDYRVGGWVA